MHSLKHALLATLAGLIFSAVGVAAETFVVDGASGFNYGDMSATCAAPGRSCGAFEPSCGAGDPSCGGPCEYEDYCCDGICPHRWLAGIDLTIVKPIAANNVAFTLIQTDGANSATSSQTDFDYNMAFAPRVWVEVLCANDFGVKATYWIADQTAPTQSGTAPANGLGFIAPPVFGTVNLATNVPDSTLTTSASITAYTIDLEGVKHVPGSMWKLCFSGGVRYAHIEQQYRAELRDDFNTLAGAVTYNHYLQGVGPTFALTAGQPLGCRLSLFGQARGSVLFGETATRLDAGEDLNDDPFLTTATASRQDLFSIGEIQVGLQWSPEYQHPWKPLVRVAFEGQIWDGPGSAAQEGGLTGFYGANITLGMAW